MCLKSLRGGESVDVDTVKCPVRLCCKRQNGDMCSQNLDVV